MTDPFPRPSSVDDGGFAADAREDTLVVRGSCDATSARGFESELQRLEQRSERFGVDLSGVVFADSTGLEPIAESIRRCRAGGRPDPSLHRPSPAVQRVFDFLGVTLDPFDLAAWDAFDDPLHWAHVWRDRQWA